MEHTTPLTLATDRMVAVANAATWPKDPASHAELFDALKAARAALGAGNVSVGAAAALLSAMDAAPWPGGYNMLLVSAMGELRAAVTKAKGG